MRIDLKPYYASGNRALLLGVAAVIGLAGTLLLGPGATYRETLLREEQEKDTEFQRWQDDFRGYRPIEEGEREAWRRDFESLLAWIPVATDEPSTMTQLARMLEAPTTRDLQVQPGNPLSDRGIAVSDEMALVSPLDARTVRVRAVPVDVSFKCGLEDLREILRRLESKHIPALADGVRVRRLFGELDVRLDLVLFVREEGRS